MMIVCFGKCSTGWGGVTSYILVYRGVPLDWVGFLSCQIDDWGRKFSLGYVNEGSPGKQIISLIH
jgi:hypothetical protein